MVTLPALIITNTAPVDFGGIVPDVPMARTPAL